LLKRRGLVMTTSDKDWTLPDVGEALSREHDRTVRHSLQLDVEFYKELLEDADIDDAQKEHVSGALWKIIIAFVELGFDVHPTQQVCGKGGTKHDHASILCEDGLESNLPSTEHEDVVAPEP
jgi:hypothetical protein